MELHFSDAEQTTLLRLAHASGKNLQDYLQEMIRQEMHLHAADDTQQPDFRQWQHRLNACIERHPKVGHVDTSRASIYDGRR
ncbi:MAG: hypothetical protein KDA99_27470 [Planctomycetales bacterium]|nr:hypothetical protein [Planctomycetales bacterium]